MTASKLQLKKNNIMALAAHAVSNREKLDNMFAEQRKTKRDAARKYGKTLIYQACFFFSHRILFFRLLISIYMYVCVCKYINKYRG